LRESWFFSRKGAKLTKKSKLFSPRPPRLCVKRVFISHRFLQMRLSRNLGLMFLRVLSNQKEPEKVPLIFAGQQMSYYGGTELPEALKGLAARTTVLCRRKIFGIDSNSILDKRIALIAAPSGFRGLCIENV
jgi:hypothetical protein